MTAPREEDVEARPKREYTDLRSHEYLARELDLARAEVARLSGERDEARERADHWEGQARNRAFRNAQAQIPPLERSIRYERDRAVAAEGERERLREALEGTRERTFADGLPCWCPDWRYEDFKHGFDDAAEFVHHEACVRARAALSAGTEQPQLQNLGVATGAERPTRSEVPQVAKPIYRDRWGFTLVIGPWAARFCYRGGGRFSNGSRWFSGWHRWGQDG